jgi:hypothetical protein
MNDITFRAITEALNVSIYCEECRGKMRRFRREDMYGIIHVCDKCGHFVKED